MLTASPPATLTATPPGAVTAPPPPDRNRRPAAPVSASPIPRRPGDRWRALPSCSERPAERGTDRRALHAPPVLPPELAPIPGPQRLSDRFSQRLPHQRPEPAAVPRRRFPEAPTAAPTAAPTRRAVQSRRRRRSDPRPSRSGRAKVGAVTRRLPGAARAARRRLAGGGPHSASPRGRVRGGAGRRGRAPRRSRRDSSPRAGPAGRRRWLLAVVSARDRGSARAARVERSAAGDRSRRGETSIRCGLRAPNGALGPPRRGDRRRAPPLARRDVARARRAARPSNARRRSRATRSPPVRTASPSASRAPRSPSPWGCSGIAVVAPWLGARGARRHRRAPSHRAGAYDVARGARARAPPRLPPRVGARRARLRNDGSPARHAPHVRRHPRARGAEAGAHRRRERGPVRGRRSRARRRAMAAFDHGQRRAQGERPLRRRGDRRGGRDARDLDRRSQAGGHARGGATDDQELAHEDASASAGRSRPPSRRGGARPRSGQGDPDPLQGHRRPRFAGGAPRAPRRSAGRAARARPPRRGDSLRQRRPRSPRHRSRS